MAGSDVITERFSVNQWSSERNCFLLAPIFHHCSYHMGTCSEHRSDSILVYWLDVLKHIMPEHHLWLVVSRTKASKKD